ncbi:Hypothetical predicted protein [Paramuricea clavata]|uniref:Uncharacterized protein n=1 Tax=Paramuricea clavata TaxID=317549 RepID=A0A7D9IDI5_PARCT|nr:Hypothetical predicted protein [Paramuricea clavata]
MLPVLNVPSLSTDAPVIVWLNSRLVKIIPVYMNQNKEEYYDFCDICGAQLYGIEKCNDAIHRREEIKNSKLFSAEEKNCLSLIKTDLQGSVEYRNFKNFNIPWVSREVKEKLFKRDALKRKAIKTNKEEDWRLYKSSRNDANTALCSAKRDYYANKFTNNKQNPKYAWRTINDIVGRINEIKLPGKTVTSTDELVDIFNDHFSNIGPKLAESIPNDNDVSFRDFITQQKSKTKNSFSFRPVSVTLVYTLLVNLSTTKATGMDKISAKILQVAAPVIAPSLTEIFNMSIDSDQFPSDWKAARVIPLFKKGQRSMLDNYRPISILPVVSKLVERIMYDQMYEYLNQNNLFSKHHLVSDLIIPQLLHYWIVRTNGIPTWTVGCIT